MKNHREKLHLPICIIFLFIAIIILSVSCSDNKKVLYVYNWSDYLDPKLVTKFEKLYNCRIIFDYFDSNEAMYAKLKVGCSGYDLIVPSSYMASIMYKQKMVKKIDKTKTPNLKYADYKYSQKTEDPDMIYSVPFAVSFTGIGYNAKRIKNIRPTCGMFDDNEYSGRMTMLDDMREAIGASLKYLGYSLNTVDDDQLNKARIQMLKWKKNLAAYQSDAAKSSLGAGILLLIQAYNGDIYQMKDDNPALDFIVPREGTSIGVDVMVIPTDAVNTDLACKFINFMYAPENCADNMEYIYYLCPNKAAFKLLDRDLRKKLIIPEKILDKSEVIIDLGADNEKYVSIWDEIKA